MCLCTASCSEWELGLDGAFHVLLPLIPFEGILKASLPSADENLSCSSGIEVQCFCVKKRDLLLLMGKIKLCVCVWTNLRGIGANMIEEINFVILLDFGLGVEFCFPHPSSGS